jgi:heptosyltransferase-2
MSVAPKIIFVPNWLGDCVMALPAVSELLKQAQQDGFEVELAAKSKVADFWTMIPGIKKIHKLSSSTFSFISDSRPLREHGYQAAYLLPRTFRSALTAKFSAVQKMIGFSSAGFVSNLYTQVVDDSQRIAEHQSRTYLRLISSSFSTAIEYPQLSIPFQIQTEVDLLVGSKLEESRTLCLLPGAARGSSKRWPAERFAAVATELLKTNQCDRVVVLGAAAEVEVCDQVLANINSPKVISLAGKTNLLQLCSIISRASLVLCNDSGGMHLAAAFKRPLVAVFGETDPKRTGPLGTRSFVIQKASRVSTKISAESKTATEALLRVQVADVLDVISSNQLLS